MMSGAHENHTPFRVEASQQVLDQIKLLGREAIEKGKGFLFEQLLKNAYARLQNDPYAFGEPLFRLPNLALDVRLAVLNFVVIDFAVNAKEKFVIIRRVMLQLD